MIFVEHFYNDSIESTNFRHLGKKYTMKIIRSVCLLMCIQFSIPSASAQTPLNNKVDSLSYALGRDLGGNLMKSGLENINIELVRKGLEAAMGAEQVSQLSDAEVRQMMRLLQVEARAIVEKKNKAIADKNLAEGQAFLEANGTKEGVVTTESGLQYVILRAGEGTSPTAQDKVEVHYEGRLLDGTVFDSSYEKGVAAVFSVGGLVKGWTEALQLMKPGARWQLFVPPHLGYGQRGTPGGPIGPNATLVFELELIGIE